MTQLRDVCAENNALAQLENIRVEMNTLRSEIEERLVRLNQLEQRLTQIESMHLRDGKLFLKNTHVKYCMKIDRIGQLKID